MQISQTKIRNFDSSLGALMRSGLPFLFLLTGSVLSGAIIMSSGAAFAAPAANTPEAAAAPKSAPNVKTERLSNVLTTVTTTDSDPDEVTGEPWKGQPDMADFDFGAMSGLGFVQGSPAFAVVGTISRKIDYKGFIPGIRNSLSIEATVGPMFLKGSSAFSYSTHLRWDFRYDDTWTYYALGGPAGYITGTRLGDQFALYPRFGVGAFWQITPVARVRFELSHELTAIGIALPI